MTMATLFMRFTSHASSPVYPVRERLDVFSDGQAVLWVTAAADAEERNRCGSFLARLDGPEMEAALALAARLAGRPADQDHTMPRGVQVEENLLVEIDGVRRGFNLNYRHDETVPEELAHVLAFREKLLSDLRAAPLAVMAFDVRQVEVFGFPELVFTCRSVGSGSVEFLFEPGSLGIRRRGADGWQPAWQHPGDMDMGLIGKLGILVDGLYAPAVLTPGETGRLVVPLEAGLETGSENEGLWARLEGRVRLVGPGYEDREFSDDAFVLECKLA